MTYPCPCCHFLTLSEPPPGSYELCPVCYWEDDAVQAYNPDLPGGANMMSLGEARKNFLMHGAVSPEFVSQVRKPLPNECPQP